jgi:hypothetical protein
MSTFKLESPRQALLLAGISAMACVLCAASIGVAEAFMPDNVHGRQGVMTFYRWFAPCFLAWLGVGVWAANAYRSLRVRDAG